MHAAKRNNRVALRFLLKWGADPDATDDEGRTALLDATAWEARRLLLDAGADPDQGRIIGMTLLALMASFRDRTHVDLLLAYGADPDERTREGASVRAILDDTTTVWMPPLPRDTPETRANHAEAILKLSEDLTISPEAFVAAHRNILIWSYAAYPFDRPELALWAEQVSSLLADPDALERAYRQNLTGDELDEALRSLVRPKQRAERERTRKERDAEFKRLHLTPAPETPEPPN